MDKKQESQLPQASLYELPAILNMSKKQAKLYNEDLDKSKEELLKVGDKELEKNPELSTGELALKFAMFERDKSKKMSFRRKVMNVVVKEMEKKIK
ncbi:hypothetical protein [Mammaliicoccus sciuri]|uniref:hypothetical protein n=1 Tax=Mammaliicoccus sciuri TaxID=1296 RepID=UPI002B26122F|nr:hypothetical protein [Mammaliicoccus sciuri]WQK75129.1 hypothetical protein P3U33_05210 [Mammaliicoccus sciuri]